MMNTPNEAREALKQLCALSKHLGKDVDLGCVKKLVMFINEVERTNPKQVPALFQPPMKRNPPDWFDSCKPNEHPFLQPLNIGD